MAHLHTETVDALNESPSEKEGKWGGCGCLGMSSQLPSMKVPPKRKGNELMESKDVDDSKSLNESPSEKEGKFLCHFLISFLMRVPQ